MEEKKKKPTTSKKTAKSPRKKESIEEAGSEQIKAEKEEIKIGEEPRKDIQYEFSQQQETELRKNLFTSIIQTAKDKINSQIQIAKNMYSLFQGMKQAYGGDTKKVLQVAFGFAKEEIKRRAKEKANELKEKANEIREKAKKIVKI
jgi:hypothetical protein